MSPSHPLWDSGPWFVECNCPCDIFNPLILPRYVGWFRSREISIRSIVILLQNAIAAAAMLCEFIWMNWSLLTIFGPFLLLYLSFQSLWVWLWAPWRLLCPSPNRASSPGFPELVWLPRRCWEPVGYPSLRPRPVFRPPFTLRSAAPDWASPTSRVSCPFPPAGPGSRTLILRTLRGHFVRLLSALRLPISASSHLLPYKGTSRGFCLRFLWNWTMLKRIKKMRYVFFFIARKTV